MSDEKQGICLHDPPKSYIVASTRGRVEDITSRDRSSARPFSLVGGEEECQLLLPRARRKHHKQRALLSPETGAMVLDPHTTAARRAAIRIIAG